MGNFDVCLETQHLSSFQKLACLPCHNFAIFPLDMYVVDKFLCTDKFETILRRVFVV